MKRPSARTAGTIGLWIAALASYLPVWTAGFIWNDRDYVTRPALRSLHGLRLIWTQVGATEQYYPLLHSFFWIQHRLWGNAALGYHGVNVALHAISAVLFWRILERWWPDRPGVSWFAAMLFAVHPVMAESVAWISEQKNTLSLVFYLLAATRYWRFFEGRRKADWWMGFGLLVCALLSKSVTATLPAALLVVIWWRTGRVRVKEDVVPLLPWFAVAAGWGLFSAWVEKTYVGAQGADFALSAVQRVLLAARIPWFYLAKLVWPEHLVFIYPRWEISVKDPFAWIYFTASVYFVLGVVVGWAPTAITAKRRGLALGVGKTPLHPGPVACALFFVGSLFPTLGFFNVYAFIYSYVADHWDYLPALGVFAGAAYLLSYLTRTWPRALRTGCCGLLLAILAGRTFQEARAYHDAVRFYATIVARNPDAWMAQHNLGDLLAESGRDEAALPFYVAALRTRSNLPLTEYSYGNALGRLSRSSEAEQHYRAAISLLPNFAAAHDALGRSLLTRGDPVAALDEFTAVSKLNPHFPALNAQLAEADNNAGATALQNRDLSSASRYLGEALKLNPDYAVAWANLGRTFVASQQPGAAIAPLEHALSIQPNFPEAENDLGVVFATLGRPLDAIPHYEAALRLRPNYPEARHNLQLARSAGR